MGVLEGLRLRKPHAKPSPVVVDDGAGEEPLLVPQARSWAQRGMPSIFWFVVWVTWSLGSLWWNWHVMSFASVALEPYQHALEAQAMPPAAIEVAPPVPTDYGCEQCHPMPMNASLFNCIGCRAPPPPPQQAWEHKMNVFALQREALDAYYHEHTLLFRDNVCPLTDGFHCPSTPMDFLLIHGVLEREPITVHPAVLLSGGWMVCQLALLAWLVARFVRLVRRVQAREAEERREAQEQRERDAATRASTDVFAPQQSLLFTPPQVLE